MQTDVACAATNPLPLILARRVECSVSLRAKSNCGRCTLLPLGLLLKGSERSPKDPHPHDHMSACAVQMLSLVVLHGCVLCLLQGTSEASLSGCSAAGKTIASWGQGSDSLNSCRMGAEPR